MPDESGELYSAFVTIRAKQDQLRQDLSQSRSMVENTMGSIKSVIVKAMAVIGAGWSIKKIIEEAMESEKAVFVLNAALKTTGEYSAILMNKFENFAKSIQKVTKYSDEEVLAIMLQQKQLGVHADKLEKTTQMAIGLAAATGRGTSAMGRAAAMIEQGSIGMLRRFIPALKSTTDHTKQLQIVQEFAARGFKIAQAEADTTTGALKQMKNAIGEIAEAIGKPFLNNIAKGARGIRDWALEHESTFGKMSAAIDRMFERVSKIIENNSKGIIDWISKIVKKFTDFVSGGGLETSVLKVSEWGEKIYSRIKELYNMIVELWKGDNLKTAIEYGLDVALASFEKWGKQLEILFSGIMNNIGAMIGEKLQTPFINAAKEKAANRMAWEKWRDKGQWGGGGLIEWGIFGMRKPKERNALIEVERQKIEALGKDYLDSVRSGNKKLSWEDIKKRVSEVEERKVPLPKELEKPFKNYRDAVIAEDKIIEKRYKVIQKEVELARRQENGTVAQSIMLQAIRRARAITGDQQYTITRGMIHQQIVDLYNASRKVIAERDKPQLLIGYAAMRQRAQEYMEKLKSGISDKVQPAFATIQPQFSFTGAQDMWSKFIQGMNKGQASPEVEALEDLGDQIGGSSGKNSLAGKLDTIADRINVAGTVS